MIVAGEASGDMHGARLVSAIKRISSGSTFSGIGGDALKAEGVELLCDASKIAVVGLLEVFGHLKDILGALRAMERRMRERPPALLILIDFPDFNLILAKKAKKLGIPVLYYISPQVWAWRSGRVKKIRRLVDEIAVILPFEKEFYRKKGVRVSFVGHPLLDFVKRGEDRNSFIATHGIRKGNTLVGILPGSRKREVSSMLPLFVAAAEKLADRHDNLTFLIPLASTLKRSNLDENGLAGCHLDVRVISEKRYDLMAACDVVMTASGTVTLELAILNVPMVVAYRLSPVSHFIGSRLIRVKYASLVNLIANREVAPELLQYAATTDNIFEAVSDLLGNRKKRQHMRRQLTEVCRMLGEPGASYRTAELVLDMIGR
ncbi:MAG: lipid-A-disaccharide synthase [Desulfobulbaceae bacterium]|nr:lipid-A-disaccharide synthase [Desulfobulbaceae bacterium]